MIMKALLAIILTAVTGCATTAAIDPVRGIYDHGWDSVRRAETDADARATAEAQADILRAFTKLKGDLEENSSDASRRGKDMAEVFHGRQMPQFSPDELGDIVRRLIAAAAEAGSSRLVDFRQGIADRDHPDGFDPVRRTILDQELKRRGIIAHRIE